MNRNTNKKIFHVIAIITIITIIIFIAGMFILNYQVKGESNMPFKITKISVIQSVEGNEKEGTQEKWNFNINQNNDIYIYIEKNSGYRKTQLIKDIQIKNITINKNNEKGETKIYKPVIDEKKMFINIPENEISEIIYKGELESNIKEQKISNQGGIVAFRYGINNISTYVSEENTEINHSQLLKMTNIQEQDLQTQITFDIILNLESGKKYQSTIKLDIPTENIIEKGTEGTEITELDNIIFKRVES